MSRTIYSLATVAALALAGPASAQVFDLSGTDTVALQRVTGGAALLIAQPVQDFRRNVATNGVGFGGAALFRLDRTGALALRVDGGFVNYGRESQRVPLSNTIGGRILVDVNTNNNIVVGGIGPQLMVPRGALRPYVNGTVGLSYFVTQSSVSGSETQESFASTTHQDDANLAWSLGGGIAIPIVQRRQTWMIDIGTSWRNSGVASYLKEGSVQDGPGNTVRYDEMRSQANMWVWNAGVRVAF